MNIVGYGGGTNITAMLIGMHRRGIPVDLILFSDVLDVPGDRYALRLLRRRLTHTTKKP